LRESLQNDRGRLASLEALQEAALGKPSAQVSEWLDEHALSERERLAQELIVEPGWERAAETVLGAYLQAISVDSIDALAKSLPALAGGGLTLIESSAERGHGASGGDTLLAHVRGPAALGALLKGVRVAASLQDAFSMRSRLGDEDSIVTRDGFWVGRRWLRINRNDDPQVGVLTRAEEIKKLRESVSATAIRVEEVAKMLADTRSELERLEDSRAMAQGVAGRRQQVAAQTKAQLLTRRGELEQIRSRAAALDQQIADLASSLETLAASAAESVARRDEALETQGRSIVQRETLEGERKDLQERLSEARGQAEEQRLRAQEIAIKVESRRSSKESASAALVRVQSQQAHLLKRQRELQAEMDAASPSLQADEQALVTRLDERLGVEANLAHARTATEEVDSQLREAEHERSQKQQAVDELRAAADNVRLAVREAQVRAEAVTEQFTETGFDLPKVLAELPPDATETVWHENVDHLERRIQRLGAINLAAIDEFQEQSERKKYLDAQFADLTEALETLENAIRKIDRETRSRFKETFDKANQGLGRVFPRLFGGGHAYLEMDGEDLLASGVTVMARPPGKKISTIHLLSGGEKALTAVALVFSIFELNPAPFCLLDEVDAPLDDANVGRFSEIVRDMSQQVQFVIITHNKTTMEAMNQLTGVTMHEPGVSRMVAVDIDEAVKLAAM
jgi:chromosome segregation protein